ncbi:MAG TPA: hypothetical protein VNF47_01670 [Streptosporangiaceae bacterium]|nr:hypothetical protein [Streptosporangiaceae bacterium]
MYQPYPPAGPDSVPPAQPAPPRPVVTAVRLMYAGAAVSAAEIIIGLATIGNLRSAIRSQFPHYTASQVHSAQVATLTFAAVAGLLAIGLWVWMAWANGAGKSWARIVASVLFGINTIDLLTLVARPYAITGLLLAILVWLIGLGAIVLLWQRESSAYYQARSGPRYGQPG